MTTLNQHERLRRALTRQPVDRPPVVCPGGMMSLAIVEVMEACGCRWPQAHTDLDQMLGLALAMYDLSGIENLAVPFCMTVEAEALGAEVQLGDLLTQPRILQEPYASASELLQRELPEIGGSARAQTVLKTMRQAVAQRPQAPLIGNLIGPVSLLASLVQPDLLLRELYRAPGAAATALEVLTERLLDFGREQIAAGAEVIAIADPTATGEILGPRLFGKHAAPPLRALVRGLQASGALVVVHICGSVKSITGELASLGADAVSVDDMVKLSTLREALGGPAVMGNLSTFLLQRGPLDRIVSWVERIGTAQADVIAPACAVVPDTPLAHVQAFAEAVGKMNGGAWEHMR